MRGMKMLRRKHILISLPMHTYQHRQGFEGILRYVKENRSCDWTLIPKTDTLPYKEPLNIKPFDGALVYTENDAEWDHVLSTHIRRSIQSIPQFKSNPQNKAHYHNNHLIRLRRRRADSCAVLHEAKLQKLCLCAFCRRNISAWKASSNWIL